jgi:hypothetical protein
MNHDMPTLGEALGVFLYSAITALLIWVNDWWKRKQARRSQPHHPLHETTDQNERQTEILGRLRDEYNAMRAYLSKFHNGDQYVDGSDILRKSRVAEVVRDGVSHEVNRFRAVLISTIADEMKYIQEDGPGWFCVDQLHLSNFRQMMEECGVKAGARQAVFKAGKPVGFIGLDFDHCRKPENLEVRLKEYAAWIEKTL